MGGGGGGEEEKLTVLLFTCLYNLTFHAMILSISSIHPSCSTGLDIGFNVHIQSKLLWHMFVMGTSFELGKPFCP